MAVLPLPPVDAPPVAAQQAAALQAGFQPGLEAAELCGFSIPTFLFKIAVNLPFPAFPPALPTFRLALGLNCSLTNPLDFSAGLQYGGGRVPTFDPDPDLALDEATS